MAFVFTSQRRLEEIKGNLEGYYICNKRDSKQNRLLIESVEETPGASYEGLIDVSRKVFKKIEKSEDFEGLSLGLCECKSKRTARGFKITGVIFCIKCSTSHLRRICSQSNQSNYYL